MLCQGISMEIECLPWLAFAGSAFPRDIALSLAYTLRSWYTAIEEKLNAEKLNLNASKEAKKASWSDNLQLIFVILENFR